jgi:hypothetical protein
LAKVKMANKEVPHDLLSEWKIVFKALGAAKETRNRLAHGEIQMPGRQIRGKLQHQARLTASSFDIGRTWKEAKPKQWPGLSVRDVMATANLFFWLAVRIEEIARYWETYSLRWKQPPLPDIYARIVDRRRIGPPPLDDQTSPKPKVLPPASQPKPKGPRLSAKQRRLAALERKKLKP